jgi:phosphonoacetate hydrolase
MICRMNRRDFVLGGLGSLLTAPMLAQNRRQRVIVFLVDGLGAEYISASDMPVLKSWGRKGIVKTVDGVMPSVTNANNTSVCCGVWPEEHGITANFFFNEATGEELYMESAGMVLRPTLFEKAAAAGITSALLSAKKKTVTLLPRGAEVVMPAEIRPANGWSGLDLRPTFTVQRLITGC